MPILTAESTTETEECRRCGFGLPGLLPGSPAAHEPS